MRVLSFLAAAILCGTAAAQQQIEIYPGTTSFTSRGSIGTNAGEILQGFHASHWRNIGDNGTACQLQNFFCLTQDQNGSTQETFYWTVRRGSDAAGPTVGSAGQIARIGPFGTPASTSNTPVAWGLTTALATPVTLDNCTNHFCIGQEYGAQPLWTSDGQSNHASRGDGVNSVQGASALAQTTGTDSAWQIIGAATVATHPSAYRSWRMGVNVAGATLQMGVSPTATPGFGTGGMYPEISGAYSARMRFPVALSGGTAFLYVSFTPRILGDGFSLFPGTARLTLTSAPFAPFVGSIATVGGVGECIIPIVTSVPGPVGPFDMHCQGAGINGSLVELTNGASSTFQ
ncbi:MAG: hypothetical protein H6837_05405 [Planctomycetes bacterium]|nr:hypothetical protein [Planctomycetota bacterium]